MKFLTDKVGHKRKWIFMECDCGFGVAVDKLWTEEAARDMEVRCPHCQQVLSTKVRLPMYTKKVSPSNYARKVRENDSCRCFIQENGAKYPVIAITVYSFDSKNQEPPTNGKSVRFSVTIKSKDNQWWTDCLLPNYLIPVAIEMLQEIYAN
jgi:hypothetical protein